MFLRLVLRYATLMYYKFLYGEEHIYDLEPDGNGGFFIAVAIENLGCIQQDINNNIAFICYDKLIYHRRH